MNDEAYDDLLRMVANAVRQNSQESLATLMQALRDGSVPKDAVWKALRQFEGPYYQTLADAFSEVLGTSLGVQQIRAMEVSGLALSTHLYGFQASISNEVAGLINRHAKGMQDARALALEIYEGYGFRDREALRLDPKNPRLPRYLREVLQDDGFRTELQRVIVRHQVSELRTGPLRAAYMQAIDAVENGAGEARLQKALDVAYQERMRYFANRIAQTELHRAYTDDKALEYMAEPDLTVLQWRLSAAHPKEDICDLHARLDKYGLGPGCYPKALAPKPPAHPHCHCKLVRRWDLDSADAKARPKAEQAFLIAAGDKAGPRIMGSRERWHKAKTGKATVDEIINAGKDPLYRLARVGDVSGIESRAMKRLPNFENATIAAEKLAGYALNPDHPTGGHKARRIMAALGFGQSDAQTVAQMISDNLGKHPSIDGASNQWGRQFAVDMPLTGPAGTAIVRTAWIIDEGSDIPRLTSFYVKES